MEPVTRLEGGGRSCQRREKRTEVERGWTKVVEKKGVCTSAGVFVPPSKWVAGVFPRHGDIPKANVKHEGRITRALLDFTGGIYIYVIVHMALRRNVHQK